MKKCSFCAEEIQDEAVKCKHCGGELGAQPQPPKKIGLFRKIAGIGCLSMIGLVALSALMGKSAMDRAAGTARGSLPSTTPSAQEQPAVAVPLPTLLGEYKNNEVRADSMFKGKRIRVTGRVDDIKKDILDHIYVTLGTGKPFEMPQVQCFFDDALATQAASHNKGDVVTVEGRADGLMMNVLVRDCVFVN